MNICIDPILKDLLKDRGITAEVFDAVLSKSEKQQMLEDLEVFASNWFMRNGKDITEYRNVSIGAAIHDDVLSFFYFLYHILLIIEKLNLNENKVVFYQSVSCRLPKNVEDILFELGIKIETTDDKYPFPCYRKAFEKSGYSRKTYTGIVYDFYTKTKNISTVRPGFRSLSYKIMLKIVSGLYLNSRKIIYLRSMRRLQPMLNSFMNNGYNHTEIQLKVAFPETNLGYQVNSLNYLNTLRLFRQLIKLAKRGVFLKHSTYMLAPRYGILSNKLSRNAKIRQVRLIKNSKESIEKLIALNDLKISNLFISEFMKFYSHHLNKFIGLINKLHREVKKNNANNYLVEYINPFMAQVLANYKKNINFIHVSRWLNNQYFCKQLINKIKNRFFILVSSEFERTRVLKQGFDESSIIKVHESYFENRNVKRNDAYKIYEKKHFLEGKTVLVITPPLAVLWTFRALLYSTFFMDFISDIATTLDLFRVSKIIIRPTMGTREINSINFTLADLYEHMLKDIKTNICNITLRNEKEIGNIKDDLRLSDLIIGTKSASAIDAALEGLDYIAYDNSVFPFPDSLNLSIFSSQGPIPVMSNKDELIKHLETYKPNYGRKLTNYINPYEDSTGMYKPLDQIYFSDVF